MTITHADIITAAFFGVVTQWWECLSVEQEVAGSNPVSPAQAAVRDIIRIGSQEVEGGSLQSSYSWVRLPPDACVAA